MSFFLVYSYNNFSGYSRTIYHRGIYTSLSEAKKRQIEICGEKGVEGINGSVYGNGLTVFINVLPQGDCNIETYTTSPKSCDNIN